MARHAGFGAVATIKEELINKVMAAYIRDMFGPFYFPPPTTISVGNAVISIGGIMEMLPPTVELHPNPSNIITAHFGFEGILITNVSVPPSPFQRPSPPENRTLRFTGSATVGLIHTIQNNQVVLGIDTNSVNFQPFSISVLKGKAIPSLIHQALTSNVFANSITAFVRSLPPVTISPPMLLTQINHDHWLNLKTGSVKISIKLSASRIIIKILENAVTIGIDFEDKWFSTWGNPDGLVDLTKIAGSGYVYKHHIGGQYPWDDYMTQHPEPAGGNIASCINLTLITNIVDKQIAPALWKFRVANNLELLDVAVFPLPIPKLHPPGTQQSLGISIEVYVEEATYFAVTVLVGLQAYQKVEKYYQDQGHGPIPIVKKHGWHISGTYVSIEEPWWIDLAIVLFSGSVGLASPLLLPFLGISAFYLISNIIPNLLEGGEQQIQSSIDAFSFPDESTGLLPGLSNAHWSANLNYISFTMESIDLAITMDVEDLSALAPGSIYPQSWMALEKVPIPVNFSLRDNLKQFGNDINLHWTVRRPDTKKIIVEDITTYFAPGNVPYFLNGVLIPHHTSEFYYLSEFSVNCKGFLRIGNQEGEIFSVNQTIIIKDELIRKHKYVELPPHDVYFSNEGTNNDWWCRKNRRSRIHRTAVSARCKELREGARKQHYWEKRISYAAYWGESIEETELIYIDELPFSFSSISLIPYRKILCDYCFFGGPDKDVPFPEEDWF